MSRDLLALEAKGYVKGLDTGRNEMKPVCQSREQEAYREGVEDQKRRQHRYAWGKLFVVVFGAAFAAHFVWAVISLIVNL